MGSWVLSPNPPKADLRYLNPKQIPNPKFKCSKPCEIFQIFIALWIFLCIFLFLIALSHGVACAFFGADSYRGMVSSSLRQGQFSPLSGLRDLL